MHKSGDANGDAHFGSPDSDISRARQSRTPNTGGNTDNAGFYQPFAKSGHVRRAHELVERLRITRASRKRRNREMPLAMRILEARIPTFRALDRAEPQTRAETQIKRAFISRWQSPDMSDAFTNSLNVFEFRERQQSAEIIRCQW